MLMHATRSRAVDGPPLRLYPRDPQRLSQAVRFPKEHLVWGERNLRLARLFSPSREAREKQGSRKQFLVWNCLWCTQISWTITLVNIVNEFVVQSGLAATMKHLRPRSSHGFFMISLAGISILPSS